MWRALGWLGVAALALAARWFDSPACRAACAFVVLVLIGASAPRALRWATGLAVLVALILLVGGGVDILLSALPALISGLIAWIFARSLLPGRRALIAKAIASLDGAAQLDDPAVARYAYRLTWVWALYQSALAILAALLALQSVRQIAWLPSWMPGPSLFGTIVLPAAVLTLFLGEFALRRWLLPQAPRHGLFVFARDLIRAWPRLIGD
jgi:uncharacterized membrane protein